jgi:hypothetical protein
MHNPMMAPTAELNLPLSSLLSRIFVAFTIEADTMFELEMPHRTALSRRAGAPPSGPWLVSAVMHFTCFKHLGDGPLTIDEVRARARAPTNIDGVRRWGYVKLAPPVGSRSAKPGPQWMMTLTPAGRKAAEIWPGVFDRVFERWSCRIGSEGMDQLHGALTAIATLTDRGLPECLPILARGFSCGQRVDVSDPWAQPVGVDDMPFYAALSRVLLAYALTFDARASISLALSANLLRIQNSGPVPLKLLPVLSGVSKEAVAMGMSWLVKQSLAEVQVEGGTKAARLTDAGRAAAERYAAVAASIDDEWNLRFGLRVAELRRSLQPFFASGFGDGPALLAAVAPREGTWRASRPPIGTLPHFPMILHRGGYPDGS